MPRIPATERGETTRKRLLESAERLFGERGYYNVGISDITREAGVALGTFYQYFEGKEAIFRELVRYLSHELRSHIREATQGLDDRLLVEQKGFQAFFQFILTHRNLYKIVREAESVDPEVSRWYYSRLAVGYQEGLEEAIEKGQIPPCDTEALAYCLMGMAYFLGMRWVVWAAEAPPPSALNTLLTFIARGLGRGEEGSHG